MKDKVLGVLLDAKALCDVLNRSNGNQIFASTNRDTTRKKSLDHVMEHVRAIHAI